MLILIGFVNVSFTGEIERSGMLEMQGQKCEQDI